MVFESSAEKQTQEQAPTKKGNDLFGFLMDQPSSTLKEDNWGDAFGMP